MCVYSNGLKLNVIRPSEFHLSSIFTLISYGSGSDESGSGGQTARGDSGEAASGSGSEGSGTYFSGSGNANGSGEGPKETKCCVLQ